MAISWPAKIKDVGGIRWQFHQVIDIVSTILDLTGIPTPVMVDGVTKRSMARCPVDARSHYNTRRVG